SRVTVHRIGNRHPAATSDHPSLRDRSRSTRGEVPILTHPKSWPESSNPAGGIDWFEPVHFRSYSDHAYTAGGTLSGSSSVGLLPVATELRSRA
ncbi:unnamed protein product, partial [Prunus brigantina]